MTMTIATNPLSYNAYITQMGILAVYGTAAVAGVNAFTDAPSELSVPAMLNYAELRIQRDLDMLAMRTSNVYALSAGSPVLQIPIDDFLTIESIVLQQLSGTTVVSVTPLVPVSTELIQNCYGGVGSAGTPKYFSMIGDNFGDGADTFSTILFGPVPNYSYSVSVRGTIRMQSLYKFGGTTVLSVTGQPGPAVALTPAQYQLPGIQFTGTLSANLVYTLPGDLSGTWTIYNNTTGPFSLTFGIFSSGVTIAQGQNATIVSNGVTVTATPNAPLLADTNYTYISVYYPDLLLLASMIYITMLQRNFGAVSDTPESGMTYEKQYQMLKISARAEEDRKKQMGSGWSGYSTPVSATPTR